MAAQEAADLTVSGPDKRMRLDGAYATCSANPCHRGEFLRGAVEPNIVCWCGTRVALVKFEDEDVWTGDCPDCGATFACTEPAARTSESAETS